MVNARQVFAADPWIEVVSALPGWTRLNLAPTRECRDKVTAFVRSQISDLPVDFCEQLSLAVDELLGNSIEHGSKPDENTTIAFTLLRTGRLLLFHIRDAGPGFSLENLDHAAVNNPPEEPLRHTRYRDQKGLRPGGFGIMLVKQIADELLYSETGNEVVMIKYLERTPLTHTAKLPSDPAR